MVIISQEQYENITSVRETVEVDGKIRPTSNFVFLSDLYKNPVFAYYTETLEEMSTDDALSCYSGIEELDSETMGTVIIAMGLPTYTPDKYGYIPTKFIIIEDYVIAVHEYTFYKLQKLEQETE